MLYSNILGIVKMAIKTIAIIVAAGFGERFADSIPKQYTSSILRQTIEKFLSSNLIDALQVVIRPEDIELYNKHIEGLKVLPVAFGGATRGDSVNNGLNAIIDYDPELVLVHDACRPFLSVTLIDKIINTLQSTPGHGVVPALPINETIKRITPSSREIVNRDHLFSIQTPQGFYFKPLLNAYQNTNHFFTDESNLMETHNIPIIYIAGEKKNVKITYKEDYIMDFETRSGSGFDAHKFSSGTSENNSIILGGITIPFNKKLEAHSDGDVLIHALVDAILGSIGAGDIGMHFPPSDQKWKNANSKLFLIHVNELLKQKNGHINNIDITVICEAPRLGAYREQIRTNLAKILDISEDRVNIKATTTEKMGFTGRGEGIAVQAIVTISLATSV